ncbi:RHS repeat-associated core domain-containing protein [Pseudomonas sp.]|uniref:RHS repeat-associated core domain-containing protein n=1 Tax=Pseudomonas sp. TaxID=306 RepID=UPI0028AB95B2|nr:RHS repeat-associated core domain-containing protein [Pseudomonas sp.]
MNATYTVHAGFRTRASLDSVTRSYCPYGTLAGGVGPCLAFTGERRSLLTGAYHLGNGHRLYSPDLRRFTSPDRLSPFGRGGLNTYAYCGADPINRVDPQGRFFNYVVWTVRILVPVASVGGAFLRTARNIINRWGGPTTFSDPHVSTRVGNALSVLGGTNGVAANVLNAVDARFGRIDMASPATWLGLAYNTGNIAAAVSSNYLAGRDVSRYLRNNPQSTGRLIGETLLEMTLADEALSAVARGLIWTGARVGDAGRGLQRTMGYLMRSDLVGRQNQAASDVELGQVNLAVRRDDQ